MEYKVFNLNIPKTKSSTIIDIDVADLNGDKAIFSYSKNIKHSKNRTSIHLENPKIKVKSLIHFSVSRFLRYLFVTDFWNNDILKFYFIMYF